MISYLPPPPRSSRPKPQSSVETRRKHQLHKKKFEARKLYHLVIYYNNIRKEQQPKPLEPAWIEIWQATNHYAYGLAQAGNLPKLRELVRKISKSPQPP